MLCRECKTETFIDHVEATETTVTYVYVCVNPNCGLYKKAQTLTKEDKPTLIKWLEVVNNISFWMSWDMQIVFYKGYGSFFI